MPLPLTDELYVEVTNRYNSRCRRCVRTFEALEPLRDIALQEFRQLIECLVVKRS